MARNDGFRAFQLKYKRDMEAQSIVIQTWVRQAMLDSATLALNRYFGFGEKRLYKLNVQIGGIYCDEVICGTMYRLEAHMPRRSVQPTFEQKAQFGAQLRTWRKMRGLKQKELAKRCGLTQNVISEYELGDQYPTDEIILRLAKELNIAPEALEDRKYTDAPSVRYGSILWRLLTDDWRTSTIDEIAAELGTTSQTVYSRLSDLKRRGYPILFRHTQHGTGKLLDPPIRVPEARQRVNYDHCKNCRYALTDGTAKPSGCLYYAYTGRHRPHPINGQCQAKDTGKRRRNVYKGVV